MTGRSWHGKKTLSSGGRSVSLTDRSISIDLFARDGCPHISDSRWGNTGVGVAGLPEITASSG